MINLYFLLFLRLLVEVRPTNVDNNLSNVYLEDGKGDATIKVADSSLIPNQHGSSLVDTDDASLVTTISDLESLQAVLSHMTSSDSADFNDLQTLSNAMDTIHSYLINPSLQESLLRGGVSDKALEVLSSEVLKSKESIQDIESFFLSDGSGEGDNVIDFPPSSVLQAQNLQINGNHQSTGRRTSTTGSKSRAKFKREHFHSSYDYIQRSRNPYRKDGSFSSSFHFSSTKNTFHHYDHYNKMYDDGNHRNHYHYTTLDSKWGRKMQESKEDECKQPLDDDDNRKKQCIRLANCAKNYNLYDLFIYYFEDDIDISKGEFKEDSDVVFDEINIERKLEMIKILSNKINNRFKREYLDEGNKCDQLLKEFHRFDDEIGEDGKWQGGSVTSVCRGWGTNKYIKLQEVGNFIARYKGQDYSDSVVVNMFEEFVGCVGVIAGISSTPLFSSGNPIRNPFLSSHDSPRLSLPLHVKPYQNDIRNKDGEMKVLFLDDFFTYFPLVDEKRAVVPPNRSRYNRTQFPIELKDDLMNIWNAYRDKKRRFPDFVENNVLINQPANNSSPWLERMSNVEIFEVSFFDYTYSFAKPEYPLLNLAIFHGFLEFPLDDSKSRLCVSGFGPRQTLKIDGKEVVNHDPDVLLPYADADAYVQSGDEAKSTYGLSAKIKVANFSEEVKQFGLLRFNATSGVKEGGILYLYVEKCDSPVTVTLTRINSKWEETNVTWTNLSYELNSGASQIFSVEKFMNGSYVDVDIDIDDLIEGTELFFLLQVTSEASSTSFVEFGSRESSHPPIFSLEHPSYTVDLVKGGTIHHIEFNHYYNQLLPELYQIMSLSWQSPYTPCNGDSRYWLSKEPQKDDWMDVHYVLGSNASALDNSIDLIFGKKTTVGQICAYAEGIEDGDVDDVPGYCCLDAPYESENWGERYSCTFEHGPKKGEQKSKDDCKILAPITTGFNEAACDTFSGTYCDNPKPCYELKKCVEDLRREAKGLPTRKAYFVYLNDAPKISHVLGKDVKECRNLREYLGYDPNFYDDDYICNEVKAIQCLDDFNNLDGLAEGVVLGEDEELVINTKIVKKKKEPFDSETAQTWRSVNFALLKGSKLAKDALEIIDKSGESSSVASTGAPGSAAPAAAASVTAFTVAKVLEVILRTISEVSQRIYDEVVSPQNSAAAADIRDATYENVITASHNIHTTFKAIQQVKQMLGEVTEKLNEMDGDDDRRLAERCSNEISLCGPEGPCSCEDLRYTCDCTLNFRYISKQKEAGCDEFDSDGVSAIDYCEDHFPPSLLFADKSLFRCDKDNEDKLCYNNEYFIKHDHAKGFLKFQLKVTDDCAPVKGVATLDADIEYLDGECHETRYQITPLQNYPGCDGHFFLDNKGEKVLFVNPLYGEDKYITVQVDEEDPIVNSGFNHVDNDDDVYSVKDITSMQTLFHYKGKARFRDANFFHNILENCPQDINVEIIVKCNEFEDRNMIRLVELQKEGLNAQAKLYYGTQSCGNSPDCEEDLTMEGNDRLTFRFYDIIVSATDASGRVGIDKTRIVLMPKCKEDDKRKGVCERRSKSNDFYYKRDYITSIVHTSTQRFVITSMKLTWKDHLNSIITSPPTLSPAPTVMGKGKIQEAPEPRSNAPTIRRGIRKYRMK